MKKFFPIVVIMLCAAAAFAGTSKFKPVFIGPPLQPSASYLQSIQSMAYRASLVTPTQNMIGSFSKNIPAGSHTGGTAMVETLSGDSVGYTWDDRETYNSMQKHCVYFGSGAASMVSMGMVISSSTFTTGHSLYYAANQGSGAHFQALNKKGKPAWSPFSSDQRVHSSMSSLSDGSEVVVADAQPIGPNFPFPPTLSSRSTSPLEFYCDSASVLSGNNWVSYPITGSTGGILPSVAVSDSNVIHVIYAQYMTASAKPGFADPAWLVYQSSRDSGRTWTPPDTVASNVQIGAYVLTAVGPNATSSTNSIAIVYNQLGFIFTVRSSDNGNTWVTHVPYSAGTHNGFSSTPVTKGDTTIYNTDTVFTWGNHLDAVLTPDNNLHIVTHLANTAIDSVVVSGAFQGFYMKSGNYFYKPDSIDAIVYFNVNDTVALSGGGTQYNTTNIGPAEGDPAGNIDLNGFPVNTFLTANGNTEGFAFTSQPQIGYQMLGSRPVLYCIYASYDQADYQSATQSAGSTTITYDIMYSHLYGVTTTQGTGIWSSPVQVTPSGYDARYPSLATSVDNSNFALTYVGDYEPGGYTEAGGPIFQGQGAIAEVAIVAPTNSLTDVHENKLTPGTFALAQNYPNPAQQTTQFQYSLQNSGNVSLKVYDMLGRVVGNVVNARENAGIHSAYFNTANLPNGVYMYTLTANGVTASNTMVIAR